MERHERTECPRRPAGCPACGKKLAAGDLPQHEEKECEKRTDACPNAFLGCYDVMPHERIAAHIRHMYATEETGQECVLWEGGWTCLTY